MLGDCQVQNEFSSAPNKIFSTCITIFLGGYCSQSWVFWCQYLLCCKYIYILSFTVNQIHIAYLMFEVCVWLNRIHISSQTCKVYSFPSTYIKVCSIVSCFCRFASCFLKSVKRSQFHWTYTHCRLETVSELYCYISENCCKL